MERVELEAFRRDPIGRFVADRTWAHFAIHAGLFGVVLFGRPDRDTTGALVRSLHVELEAHVAAHQSIIDATRLEVADEGAFDAIAAYVRAQRAALSAKVTRLVLVPAPGLRGAVVAGFFGVLEAPYPVLVATDVESGLESLGEPRANALQITSIAESATGVGAFVGRVRDYLVAHLADATIESLAVALAVSDRTLQRRLGEAGTSFRRELMLVRLGVAARRLHSTTEPLTNIALETGFSSLQHFSTKFHEVYGVSPTAYRVAGPG
ncbi:MAG: AraC family transcriptional regulator [Polyangiaceae bacterium]